jgi:hypothetical protein
VAALAALSPAVRELVGHWARTPWTLYSLAFLPLLARLVFLPALRRTAPPPDAVAGLRWILAAIALELLAAGARLPALGRPALLLGWLGASRSLGLAPLRAALLGAFVIPVPARVAGAASPWLEELQLAAAASLLALGGADVEVAGATLRAGGSALAVAAWHGGAPAAALCAGAAWYGALRLGAPAPRLAVAVAAAGAGGFALQLGALAAAGALLAAGAVSAARVVLGPAPWLGLALVAALGLEHRARRSAPEAA